MAGPTRALWASALKAAQQRLGQITERGLVGSWVLVSFCLGLQSSLPWPTPAHPSNSGVDAGPTLRASHPPGEHRWPRLCVPTAPGLPPSGLRDPSWNRLLLVCHLANLRAWVEAWSP